ncbi:MAG: glycine cleavage system aminomethyltransferase GcvT [Candidatus Lokiarchaeota archaeon]|nr:glycine cleavage system aminomethyltransferase GcvT [Candidatus Harpocratesius repetitus]
MPEPRKTPLYDMHVKLGGRIVNFEDWLMPVQFEGVIVEHNWTRQHAGIFDISHMTEFMVEGPDTIPLLKTLLTNSIGIGDFKAQYNHMCYPNGGVVDDLYIYRESEEKVRIIANAQPFETEGKDFNWIRDHIGNLNVTITDLSLERARFAFQGPETMKLLNPITTDDITTIKRFNWIYTEVKTTKGNIPIFLSRTGYTGEDDFSPELGSFEISCDKKYAEIIFQTFLDTGAKPIGLGARDSLRLECCFALYGHEINENITPIEANLSWVVKEKEGFQFIGQDVILKQKKEGTSRISVGLNLVNKGILRHGYKVFKDGKEIGYITSGTFAPTVGKSVGLALIESKFKEIGQELDVQIRNKFKKAVVVKTPFYSRGRKI